MKKKEVPRGPQPDFLTGLPILGRENLAILTRRGEVVIARNCQIISYSMDGQKCEPRIEADLEGSVTALAESQLGLFAAAGESIYLIESGKVKRLAGLSGPARSLAVAGPLVFVVVARPGRLDGTLIEIDAAQSVVVSERALRVAKTVLTADPTGSFIGISDGQTFRTMQLAPGRPCPEQSDPKPPQKLPEKDGKCCDGASSKKPDDEADQTSPPDHDPPPAEPCAPGQSGIPTPDGGRIVGNGNGITRFPPGVEQPWAPCGTHLFFGVHDLRHAGSHIIATDRDARNVAILAIADLRILHQSQYRHGATILSHPSQPQMLVFHRERHIWERVRLDKLRPGPLDMENILDPSNNSITFQGNPLPVLKGDRAPAVGNKKVLVIPALDPGQSFNDADLPKLAGYLKRVGFERVQEFYRENSFHALHTIEFLVHGVHGGSGGPVRLPKPIAEYYHPKYVGAHVDMVKSGAPFPHTVVFDGRESMTITVQPQAGGRPQAKLEVKLYALLASGVHKNYPAQVKFLGTETAAIQVQLPSGANAALTLQFTPKTFDILKMEELDDRLRELEIYLEGIFAAAEVAAGIPTRLFAKPSVRSIDQGEGGPGLIVTTVAHAVTAGPKLEVISLTYSGVTDPLGMTNAFLGRMNLSIGPSGRLRQYLDFVTTLAQEAAGFDVNQRLLAQDPVVIVGAASGSLKSTLFISNEDGGPGATMSLNNIVEMGELFDSWTGTANTNVTAGLSATPKDGNDGLDGIINHVFTAVVERQAAPGKHLEKKDQIALFFSPFQAVIIGMIFPPATHATDLNFVQPHEMWTAASTSWNADMRAVEAPRTAAFGPLPKDIQFFSNWNLVPFSVPTDDALMCHEFGHGIGLDDLYAREAGYRNDLLYMEAWAMMHSHGFRPHHCGYHKWQAGWIPDNRVHTIGRPAEDQTLTQEVLLVPVEHWHANDTLIGRARDVFSRPGLPVVQLVQLDLGGDADVFGLIEARQKGGLFSASLPLDPAVLVTNCIVWWDQTRYAFNGRYRAPVHLLHSNKPADSTQPYFARLQSTGDTFDLARGRELPVKGIVVSIIDRRNVDGVEVFHIRVERKHSKEFIDLFFTSSDPYYKNPDIWIDWTGDNGAGGKTSSRDKKDARVFPLGQPDHQGEKIQVPESGEELHWIVARLRNIGNVRAEQVKINFSICEPPGAGDRGNFKVRETITLDAVHPTGHDNPVIVTSTWNVPAGFKGHTCVMAEVADLKVPLDHTGAALASDDVRQANNLAQKNVDNIGPKSNSPFEPIDFEFSVNNSARWPEVAYLEPEALPYGMTLTVTPKRRKIGAGQTAIFRCRLELNDEIIDASCRGDHNFRINAWRVDEESSILWGGVEYQVRPRKRSLIDVSGGWGYSRDVEINGHVTPGNITGSVKIRLAYANYHARWVSADLMPGGTFSYKETAPADTRELFIVALFEGNKYYSESRSPQRRVTPPAPVN